MALRLPGSIAEVSAQSLGGGGLIQQRVREQASALSSSTPPSSPSSAFCRSPSSSSCSPSSSSSASLFNHASGALHSPHRPRSQLQPSSTKLVERTLQVSFLFGKRLAIPCCGGELYGPNRRWRLGRIVRAQQSSSSGDNVGGEKREDEGRIAPLQPQSPEGQFLAQLLKSHPHLFATAVDQQLERLAADRDANASPSSEQQGKKGSDASPSDLILYRRIADLKETERKTAIEEVIYCSIVQKFIESGVELLPELPVVKIRLGGKDVSAEEAAGLMGLPVQGMVAATMSSAVDLSPKKETLLESIHSSEALEMVREHVGMVLGARSAPQILDPNTIVQISKLRVGQVYAASIMYGYFLKRVDQRFQLEKNMRALLSSPFPSAAGATSGGEVVDSSSSAQNEGGNAGDGSSSSSSSVDAEETSSKPEDVSVSKLGQSLAAEASAAAANMSMGYRFGAPKGGSGEGASGGKPNALRAYVMSFDVETLQRNATMKSREAVSVIEKHTEALFGRPDISVVDDGSFVVVKDDNVRMNVAGLRRLVFEAVAFGSILWDVEGYVDSQYRLV